MLAPLLVALLALPALGWAGPSFTTVAQADTCSLVCEFRLCVEPGDKPRLRPCEELGSPAPSLVIRQTTYPPLRLRLRKTTASLACYQLGAPCILTAQCEADVDCAPGLACHPVMRVCAMPTTCPGPGFHYPTFPTDKKSEVSAKADPCSRVCEFRLCLLDEKLVKCAPDVEPGVVVRAPPLVTTRRSAKSTPFVLKYGRREHLTMSCGVGLDPCRYACTTPEDCFTGGACVDGNCRTTALCQ